MCKNITLILHRKSADRPEVKEAVKAVIKSGIPLKVLIPWNKKDKPVIVREAIAAGAERIIAGGGDGTINAVVNALVGKAKKPPHVELGILPLGTANDFARGCELPDDNLAECLRIACTSQVQKVDVGQMNGRNFINVASLGFGAEVTATTPQDMKKLLGGGAYTLMGLVTAMKFEPYECSVSTPDGVGREGQVLVAAVGNNRFAGGGFEVAPKASMSDGLLDLAVITHDAEFSIAAVLKELKDPFNEKNRYLQYRQLADFTIHCDRKLPCNLDGETVQKKQLRFTVLPSHLRLVMP